MIQVFVGTTRRGGHGSTSWCWLRRVGVPVSSKRGRGKNDEMTGECAGSERHLVSALQLGTPVCHFRIQKMGKKKAPGLAELGCRCTAPNSLPLCVPPVS